MSAATEILAWRIATAIARELLLTPRQRQRVVRLLRRMLS